MEFEDAAGVQGMSTHILAGRLPFLAAVVAAGARWPEVTAVIAAADDRAGARTAVAALLGVDEMTARAVLDLRWEQLHGAARRSFLVERDATVAELQTRAAIDGNPADGSHGPKD